MDDRNARNESNELISYLNRQFQKFNNQFSEQFHLKIPKNTIKTVHYYRDKYFSYLKDSVYKSNICYLLQQLDYQIWLYKVFRPQLSLANTYFYQLMVSMGIISEALCCAILLDPFIESDPKDRSLGGVDTQYYFIQTFFTKNAFSNNLNLLQKLKVLPTDTINKYQEVRKHLRNQVHIQNWEGRLYQSLQLETFQDALKTFSDLLDNINSSVQIPKDKSNVLDTLGMNESDEVLSGVVIKYNPEKGFGFIRDHLKKTDYYFHKTEVSKINIKKLQQGAQFQFRIKRGKKGMTAVLVEHNNNEDES